MESPQSPGASPRTLIARAQRIAVEVAGPAADSVDREARFPAESIEALRKEKLLSALVPVELGGEEASVAEISGICLALGQRCASAGMVYAMHTIQVACIVRHGSAAPFFRRYMSEALVEKQELLASATTELGVGGDVRTSICAVQVEGDHFRLEKNAPVISYGQNADAILVTSRRAPDAVSSDQVISLVRKPECTLEPTSGWDTLGFRGTCSLGFKLSARAHKDQILPQPYADISQQTMLPVSHIVWSSLWLGIATDAVNRARAFVRQEARKKPGFIPPNSLRLAEVVSVLQGFRANVQDSVEDYQRRLADPESLGSIGFALRMNNLKIAASQLVVQIVSAAMQIVGITGYRLDSKYTLGRHLRDAYGAALMVNNDRILGANASMLLVLKDD